MRTGVAAAAAARAWFRQLVTTFPLSSLKLKEKIAAVASVDKVDKRGRIAFELSKTGARILRGNMRSKPC